MKNQISSSAAQLANQIRKAGFSLSESFKKAWQVVKFQEWLRKGGEAIIRFFKKGEEIPEQRVAVSVTGNYSPTGDTRKRNPLQITYFDLVKQQVRSFNAARFAGFQTA